MGLREEIREYRQEDGLITPRSERDGLESPDSTGNGLLYLSLYHVLLVRLGLSTPDDVLAFEDAVHPSYGRPGVLNRSATKRGDQTGRDDYVGVVAASRALRTKDAYIIVNAGNIRRFGIFKWFYKNVRDGEYGLSLDTWKAWMGRYPSFIAFMQWVGGDIVGGITPHVLRRMWLVIDTLMAAALPKTASGVILRWLQLDALQGRCWLLDVVSAVWFDAIGPMGMKRALEMHLGKEHPIARYWV